MYIIAFKTDKDAQKLTVKVVEDLINFGMGITPEIVKQVDDTGHYPDNNTDFDDSNIVIMKEGTWDID